MARYLWLLLALGCNEVSDARYGATLDSADWQVIGDALDSWCSETACCPTNVPVGAISAETCAERVGHPCVGSEGPDGIGIVAEGIHTYTHLRSVALHEFGHACGCDHSNDERDVMFTPSIASELSGGDKECPQ